MLWKVHAAAIGDAMVAAKVAGLEPQVWWETMKGGAADSYVMHHDVPAVFAGHYDPSFPIALCLKDLDLIDELMRETGVRNDLIDATHARFREAGERYGLDRRRHDCVQAPGRRRGSRAPRRRRLGGLLGSPPPR